ncbi:hypothetical protein [Delftia acidovorans]|uniref:hypothetical protein n=1 Tax=Delftia acidovorans TaxID=80866 RepID=UPI000BDBC64E|nr:hypothetical protein [Delftia acidovorans]SOE36637.1 hypothetical protein SAMN05216519_2659 [Delftia acidovorans]
MTTLANPTSIGAMFANLAFSTTPVQIVSPSSNLHGIVIRTCYMSAVAGVMGVQLYADRSAPSGFADATKRVILIGNPIPSIALQYSLYVPPGLGLWAVGSGTGGSVEITYDVLTAPLA